MAVMQLFDGEIHFFVPGDIGVKQQARALGDRPNRDFAGWQGGVLFQMFLTFGNGSVDLTQLLDPLPDQLLFFCEKGLRVSNAQIVQISTDPIRGKSQLPQIPDDGQPINIPQAVKPVSVFTAARPDQAKAFVITQSVSADAIQPRQFLDHVFVFHHILHSKKEKQPANNGKTVFSDGS